ncbi:MAG: hypothetical protein HQ591_08080 [candidate division Zixibacteria bacterium]|nr:hypothetical protein [Candidatus Tariuqbacter arcticus]
MIFNRFDSAKDFSGGNVPEGDFGWRLPRNLHCHFIGIGGVAMGNVAVDMVKNGFKVTGSDAGIYSPMKEFLTERGIEPLTPFRPDNLQGADLIIVGNAISRGNPELEEAMRRRMTLISMPELIKWGLLAGRKNLVITGTHGKTTSTAIIAHILKGGGHRPGYLIGGVPRDFDSGFEAGKGEYFVIEGDEYDIAFFDKRAKFLLYLPFGVIINNLEYDHSDIYRNLDEIKDSFLKLVRLIPDNGYLVINGDDEAVKSVVSEARCPVITFGLGEKNRFRGTIEISRIKISDGNNFWGECHFPLSGEYNLRNALGAAALLDSVGIDRGEILRGLSGFKGVKRRMELAGEVGGIAVYDDFAHHPTAVKASIQAVKDMHPGRRIWALFQPRSNTCVTNIFQDIWVDAFAGADKVVIAELHRRDKIPPEKRLSREDLREDLANIGIEAFLWDDANVIVENIGEYLKPGDVILIMSNSDFGGLAGKLARLLGDRL